MVTLRVFGECEWIHSSHELEVLVASIRRRLQRPVECEAIFFVDQGLYGVQLALMDGKKTVAEGRSNDPDLFNAVLGAFHDLEHHLGFDSRPQPRHER
jgi:hypothetical protein